MAAAGAAVDADLRRVAVPRRRFPFEPAHAVVGVLDASRVRRFRRQRHVDGDHQHAAGRQRAVHRFLRVAVLGVPRAAVQIEHGGERSRAIRLIDAGHQHPPGRRAPELDLAHLDLEPGRGIVCRRRADLAAHQPNKRSEPQRRHNSRQAGCAQCGHRHEKVPTSGRIRVHADLLADTLSDNCLNRAS